MKKITIFLFSVFFLFSWGILNSQEKTVVTQQSSDIDQEEINKMSLQDFMTEAEKFVKEMNDSIKLGYKMVADARSKQDIQRLNCLNEGISSLKGLLRISEQNKMDLQDKVVKKDKKGAQHEFVKIKIASDKISSIVTQLKSCGGPSAEGIFDVEPTIEKDLAEDLPTGDTASALEQAAGIVNIESPIPQSASPFY